MARNDEAKRLRREERARSEETAYRKLVEQIDYLTGRKSSFIEERVDRLTETLAVIIRHMGEREREALLMETGYVEPLTGEEG